MLTVTEHRDTRAQSIPTTGQLRSTMDCDEILIEWDTRDEDSMILGILAPSTPL